MTDNNVTKREQPLQTVTKVKELVYKLRAGGCDIGEAGTIVEAVTCAYGMTEKMVECLAHVDEVYAIELRGGLKPLADRINEYINTTQGYFSMADCDKELRIEATKDKDNRRQIFHRLVSKGILQRHPSRNGLYRRVENIAPVLDWQSADVADVFRVNFPLELENHILLYPKNIAVLAGVPDAGKTAYLMNFAKMNMANYDVHYFSSEMGEVEFKVRLSKFEDMTDDDWNIDVRERSSNFADVIYPDDINIIDYFEFTNSEFFRISDELKQIFDKLRRGIAFIALQKKHGAEYGRGGELGLEKPRLYLTMESGVLTIKKGKNWAVEGMNPNGMEFHFKIINGAKFIT